MKRRLETIDELHENFLSFLNTCTDEQLVDAYNRAFDDTLSVEDGIVYDDEGVFLVEYHAFVDGRDGWFSEYEDAEKWIADRKAEGYEDLRIYKDSYYTEEDYENGVQNDEETIFAEGDFPA